MTSRRRAARLWRWLAVFAGTVLVLAAGTGPASAHNALRSTSPEDGATVPTAPPSIVLTFDEPAIALGTQVVVTGPHGEVQAGVPRLVDNTVTQDLQPGAPAGPYAVTWRVTSVDGHPVTGAYAFTARAAAPGQPPSPADASPTAGPISSNRLPGGLTLPIGALVVIAVALLAIRRARRAPGPHHQSPLD